MITSIVAIPPSHSPKLDLGGGKHVGTQSEADNVAV